MITKHFLIALTCGLAASNPTLSPTRTGTKTSTPSPHTPSNTPTASTFPSLLAETWGTYDLSGDPGTDPTVLIPVTLWRDQTDGNLYLELVNVVDPASNPPQSE